MSCVSDVCVPTLSCLGLVRESYLSVEIIHHAGAVLGCNSQMLTVPAHDLDIIVIFNRMDCNAAAMALKVVDAMLESAGLAPALAAASAEAHRHLIGRWYSAATRRDRTRTRLNSRH